MEKKYELIESDIRGLHRIKALRDFGDVKKGDVGGYVENEYNLSHDGECWIYYDAAVFDNATVWNDVRIRDKARIYGNASINDNVVVCNNARVCDDARVCANTRVCGDSVICGDAYINGEIEIKKGTHLGKVYENFKNILYIQCENRLITVYKDMNNIIKCNIGCKSGMTLEDLLQRIEENGGMNEHRKEYVRIMENAHLLLG